MNTKKLTEIFCNRSFPSAEQSFPRIVQADDTVCRIRLATRSQCRDICIYVYMHILRIYAERSGGNECSIIRINRSPICLPLRVRYCAERATLFAPSFPLSPGRSLSSFGTLSNTFCVSINSGRRY